MGQIERAAFRTLVCGLFVVSARETGERAAGCVVNTVLQVSSQPPKLLVAVNKDCVTCQAIEKTGGFAASVLSQDTTMELIGRFGFHSSNEIDKFDGVEHGDVNICGKDVFYLEKDAVAWFAVKTEKTVDVGTHLLFIGEVEEAHLLSDEDAGVSSAPLTYGYYHDVIKGKTPPKAASFEPGDDAREGSEAAGDAPATSGGKTGWRCTLCGQIIEGYDDGLPADFKCPICGVGPEFFERVEL